MLLFRFMGNGRCLYNSICGRTLQERKRDIKKRKERGEEKTENDNKERETRKGTRHEIDNE